MLYLNVSRGRSSMVEFQPSKLATWVRSPSPAPPLRGASRFAVPYASFVRRAFQSTDIFTKATSLAGGFNYKQGYLGEAACQDRSLANFHAVVELYFAHERDFHEAAGAFALKGVAKGNFFAS